MELCSMERSFRLRITNHCLLACYRHGLAEKHLSQKILSEVPVAFVAYDILEYNGIDIREWKLS